MRFTIGRKILLGFGLAVVLLVVITSIAYWTASRAARSTTQLLETADWVTHTHQVLETLENLLSLLKDAETGQRGFLITGEDRYLEPYTKATASIHAQIEHLRTLTQDNPRQQDRIKTLEPYINEKLAELQETIKLRKVPTTGFEDAKKVVMTDKGKESMDSIRRIIGDMDNEERDLLQKRSGEAKTTSDATLSMAQTATSVVLFSSLGTVILMIVIGTLIQLSITRPIADFMNFVERIGKGDLTRQATISSTDEVGVLGQNLNQMVDGLRELAAQLKAVTENLNAAGAEILASAQEQAATTRQQAATIQEITTTMAEVNQSGAQISEKAKQVASSAEAASAASTAGIQTVQDTNRNMQAIREQVEEVAGTIVALSEKTQAVGEIIATVNDIAERSNLLALNAAIEAAAAGDQGSRFSVVANEMKNLADQAKESTIQVRTILGDIQKGINSSVMYTEEAVKRVETGKEQAEVTDQTIRQMAKTTMESVQAFEQIVGANNQQQIGFEQVSQGMKDILQAAGQTAAATSQLEKAVANLNTLSQELKQAVGRYQI